MEHQSQQYLALSSQFSRQALLYSRLNDQVSEFWYYLAAHDCAEMGGDPEEQLSILSEMANVTFTHEMFEATSYIGNRMISIKNKDPLGYIFAGQAHWYQHELNDAKNYYKEATHKTKNKTILSITLSGYGQILALLMANSKAIDTLKRGLKITQSIKGDSHTTQNGLALAYGRSGKFWKAQRLFKRLIKDRPNNAWIYYYYGLVYLHRKKNRKALQQFKMALTKTDPHLPPNLKADALNKIEWINENINGKLIV